MKRKIFTFIYTLIIWIILTGNVSFETLFVGVILSILNAVLFSDMLLRVSNRKTNLIEYMEGTLIFFIFIPVFFYEALSSAIKVSRHAFEREFTFSPGIVKVKTSLTNVTAITILANLITLTPGTLTLDFDKSDRSYCIHWIDIKNVEESETGREIIEKFEKWLDVIFI